MFLIGDVKVFKVTEKNFEGKVYFSCLAMDNDKDIYKFSVYDSMPKEGDTYQVELHSSDRDLKPFCRFVKVK